MIFLGHPVRRVHECIALLYVLATSSFSEINKMLLFFTIAVFRIVEPPFQQHTTFTCHQMSNGLSFYKGDDVFVYVLYIILIFWGSFNRPTYSMKNCHPECNCLIESMQFTKVFANINAAIKYSGKNFVIMGRWVKNEVKVNKIKTT